MNDDDREDELSGYDETCPDCWERGEPCSYHSALADELAARCEQWGRGR